MVALGRLGLLRSSYLESVYTYTCAQKCSHPNWVFGQHIALAAANDCYCCMKIFWSSEKVLNR